MREERGRKQAGGVRRACTTVRHWRRSEEKERAKRKEGKKIRLQERPGRLGLGPVLGQCACAYKPFTFSRERIEFE
jgi:hypothetical protein